MAVQYKILGAALALHEFTSAELAKYSGEKLSSVHTILRRHEHFFEKIGREKTEQRGGQPIRYRVKADQVEVLQSELEKLFLEIHTSQDAADEVKRIAEIPTGYLAAVDSLLHRYTQAKNVDKKREVIEFADTLFQSEFIDEEAILSDTSTPETPETLKAYIHLFEFLKRLRTAELTIESGNPNEENIFYRLREDLGELLKAVGLGNCFGAAIEVFLDSPIRPRDVQQRPEESPALSRASIMAPLPPTLSTQAPQYLELAV